MIREQRQLTVHMAENTLALLDLLVEGDGRLTIRDLARRLNCSRNEARLLLVTLESRGILEWDEARKIYRTGATAERFAWKLLSTIGNGKRLAPAIPPTTEPKLAIKQQNPAKRPGRPRRLVI
jgi:Mn-dependent DtxR family transcriptional regulator